MTSIEKTIVGIIPRYIIRISLSLWSSWIDQLIPLVQLDQLIPLVQLYQLITLVQLNQLIPLALYGSADPSDQSWISLFLGPIWINLFIWLDKLISCPDLDQLIHLI